jgi:hypothetical protein
VYQQIDPRTGAKLSRPRGRYRTFADHLARAHRRRAARHRRTAHRTRTRSRPGDPATRRLLRGHHLVLQVHLGAARLHPGNERRARLGDDQQTAAYWAGREQAFQEALHRANRAALEYLQAWAGITRTGYHGTRIDGRDPGRFEPAGLIVTSWLQGTSLLPGVEDADDSGTGDADGRKSQRPAGGCGRALWSVRCRWWSARCRCQSTTSVGVT